MVRTRTENLVLLTPEVLEVTISRFTWKVLQNGLEMAEDDWRPFADCVQETWGYTFNQINLVNAS